MLSKIKEGLQKPENQYYNIMLPAWIKNADKIIRFDECDPDIVDRIRLKYVLSQIAPLLEAGVCTTAKNISSYKDFIAAVTSCSFKEGDFFKIKFSNGTARVFKYIKLYEEKGEFFVAVDDGESDSAYIKASSFFCSFVEKIPELENFDDRRKDRLRVLQNFVTSKVMEGKIKANYGKYRRCIHFG